MSITLVQSKVSPAINNSPDGSLAFDSDVTAGNLITVTGAAWTGGTTFTFGVNDTRSTSYSVQHGPAGSERTCIAYGIAPSSGPCTVTYDPSEGGAYMAFTIAEWSGIDSMPLDVDGGTSTGTGTTPSDGLTTVAAETLVIGVCSHFDFQNDTITPDTGGGWTQLGEYEDSAATCNYNAQYQIFSSAGAKTASWTLNNSRDWGAQTASFKAAQAGAPALHQVATPARWM